MKVKQGSLVKWITIILFVLCSGSQFGIDNARYMDIILFGFSLISFFISKRYKLTKRDAVIALYFLAVMWINYVIFSSGDPNINAYISYSLRLISALLISGCFEFDLFENRLTVITIVIAAVSICAYMLRLISPGGLGYTVAFGLFRTSNINGTIRNAGIFWEPGAYQLFLNLALFSILKKTDFKILGKNQPKLYLVLLIILVVAIISTMSTSGYVLLTLNFIVLYVANYKSMKRINKIVIGIPLLLVLLYILGQMMASDTVAGKFTGTGNVASTSIRMNDILGSVSIIFNHPFGLGQGTRMYNDTLSSYSIINNSSGILAAMCYFGILYGLPFLALLFQFSKRHVHHYWALYLAIIVLTGFNENFYFYPIYFIMLFSFLRIKNPLEEVL